MKTSKQILKNIKILLVKIPTVCGFLIICIFLETKALAKSPVETQSIEVKEVDIVGNTIFNDSELKIIINLPKNQKISLEKLFEALEKINRYYVENGYIASGATLSTQEITQGKVTIQVSEGNLNKILIRGLDGVKEEYLRSHLPPTDEPLNANKIVESLEILENNPLIENITGEIVRESINRNILLIKVEESSPFAFSIGFNNAYSPGIGSYGGNARLTHNNLLGIQDSLTIEQSLTEGLSRTGASYSFAFNQQNGRISLIYNNADSRVVEEEVADFDITADYESFRLAIEQPVISNRNKLFILGIGIEYIDSETFVLNDLSFAFTPGLPDGGSKSTILRLTQDYSHKGNASLWRISSQFNVGLDMLDTTKTAMGIDGLFWSWLGSLQYLKSFDPENNSLFLATLNFQLTPDKLLPIEQFTVGGLGKTRGYRPNIGVGDNGVVGTLELQFSLAESDSWGKLSIGPFLDWGTVWNNDRSTTGSNDFLSTGLSLQYRVADALEFRLDYGLPIIELTGYGATDTEDNLSFSILLKPM